MPRMFCCRKMELCKFCLISILLIFLYVFSNLTGFLKRFVWQNILMVQINKKFLISRIYLQLPYHIWSFPRLIHLRDKENPGPKKDFSQSSLY